ncbi:MAG: hypothetical protein R3E42_18870 [Burkholderiaceae bacterium]
MSVFWSLGSTLLAGLALLVSMPLADSASGVGFATVDLGLADLPWFAFDVSLRTVQRSASLAAATPRQSALDGVASGYMGAAPSLLWASGAMAIPLAPVLIPAAIWIYTLVFAFASLWFSHYALAALAVLRGTPEVEVLDPVARPTEMRPLPSAPPVSEKHEPMEGQGTQHKPPES